MSVVFRCVRGAFVRFFPLFPAIFVGISACGKTIFDEDWNPTTHPVHREPTIPAIPSPKVVPEPPSVPTSDYTPKLPFERVLPNTVAPVRRHPIPSVGEQAKSRAMMNAVYAEALKDHTSGGRQKLISTLYEALPRMIDTPSDEFLVLAGLLNAAKDASDLPGVVRAADLLAERFEVDPLGHEGPPDADDDNESRHLGRQRSECGRGVAPPPRVDGRR